MLIYIVKEKKGIMKNNDVFWGEDTIDHFRLVSSYLPRFRVEDKIREFVEIDCELMDGDSEEYLVNNLMNRVYEGE